MNQSTDLTLILNAGSSSIKFAVYTPQNESVAQGVVDKIGMDGTCLRILEPSGTEKSSENVSANDHHQALQIVVHYLHAQQLTSRVGVVGHRIVHGGPLFYKSVVITPEVIKQLKTLDILDPEHLYYELALVEDIAEQDPQVTQVACFDTAFHHDLPTVARVLPIPREYEAKGLRKYGFHGLSYAYIVSQLPHVLGKDLNGTKIIVAHLGSGASIAALKDGKPIDTSMGLTPTSGLVMSTRSGDIDPGLAIYLERNNNMDVDSLNEMLGFKSGLLGLSGVSADMKKLLELEETNERAHDAVEIFCYNVKKCIGAYAAALGGLDYIVFTGGMGEVAPKIRQRVCEGLEFLGIRINSDANFSQAQHISAEDSKVGVFIIPTNEALTMLSEVQNVLRNHEGNTNEINQ